MRQRGRGWGWGRTYLRGSGCAAHKSPKRNVSESRVQAGRHIAEAANPACCMYSARFQYGNGVALSGMTPGDGGEAAEVPWRMAERPSAVSGKARRAAKSGPA